MNGLVESLMEGLNYNVVLTIPLLGGIDVIESMIVTWIIVTIMMIASLILVHGLKVRNISKKQAALESGMSFVYDLFEGLLGRGRKTYIPYPITVVIYIGVANMIGLLGFRSPTKDLDVTVSLAIMNTVLVEVAGIRKKGVGGRVKNFAEPAAIIAPTNVLKLFIQPLSLYMRLFGNVLGAIVIMTFTKHSLPLTVPLPFSFYFDISGGMIQAYVFVFLTSLYVKKTIED